MAVEGPGPVQKAVPVNPPVSPPQVQEVAATQPVTPRDHVEISTAAKMLDRLNQSSEVRAERLAKIKAAIEAEEYDTPGKLEAALSLMIAEIESQGGSNE